MGADGGAAPGLPGLRRLPPESPARAVVVTGLVCLLSSVSIVTAVGVLRPYREANRAADQAVQIREIVAAVPGLEAVIGDLREVVLEARVVELATGRETELSPEAFDARAAAIDPEQSIALPADRDLAGIGRRANHATVFQVRDPSGSLRLVVLPVHGAGYVSTIRGFLALDARAATVQGIAFVEHAETPGLGAEIENPAWRALWLGKRVRDESGALRLGVARGPVGPDDSEAPYLVDGLTGATRTGVGVTRLVRFWLGPDGFEPFLERLAEESSHGDD